MKLCEKRREFVGFSRIEEGKIDIQTIQDCPQPYENDRLRYSYPRLSKRLYAPLVSRLGEISVIYALAQF